MSGKKCQFGNRQYFASRFLCSAATLLVCLLCPKILAQAPTQSPSVRLTTIDGEAVDGKLLASDSQSVQLEVYGGERQWESQKVLKLDFGHKSENNVSPLELGLVDGSKLKGVKLVGKEESWQFGDSSGTSQEFGAGVVRSLLVRNLTPDLANAWKEALQEPTEADALILLRPGNVVDRVGGIIREVKDGRVVFDLDGQALDVAFEKLLGLIWFRKQKDRIKPKIEIEFTDGSSVFAETLNVAQGNLTYRSIGGKDVLVPLSRISILNYASANVKWLAEVPVLSAVSDQRTEWKGDSGNIRKMMAPRFLSGNKQGIAIASMSPEDLDLVFPSAGAFTFRVPEGFSRFRARIERSGGGNARSELTVEVWQDDQNISRLVFGTGDENAELDVPVLSAKKIILKVSSKSRLQVGSQLTWKQPRLTR
jgi:hypothetical protein